MPAIIIISCGGLQPQQSFMSFMRIISLWRSSKQLILSVLIDYCILLLIHESIKHTNRNQTKLLKGGGIEWVGQQKVLCSVYGCMHEESENNN